MNNIIKNLQQRIGNKSGLSDPLPEDYPSDCLQIEEQLLHLRETCSSFVKRLDACVQTKNSDKQPIKKVPEYGLSTLMKESSPLFQEKNELLRSVFDNTANVEGTVAQHRCDFERDLERYVMEPVKRLSDQQFSDLLKDRARLSRQHQDLVGLCSRLETMHEENSRKRLEDEFDEKRQRLIDLQNKVQRAMYDFQCDSKRHVGYFLTFLNLQRIYHQRCFEALDAVVPKIEASIENVMQYQLPLYGVPLVEHLQQTGRSISYVLATCVEWLLSDGHIIRVANCSTADFPNPLTSAEYSFLREEGIFRMSGGKSQVAALITGFNMMCAEEILAQCDVHTVTGALKQYFRDLPNCLLWADLYERWTSAVLYPDHNQRMQALYECCQILKQQLPQHYTNLHYLLTFLTRVAAFSHVNKMKNSNLGIVFGPTLLFPKNDIVDNLDATMLASGSQAAVIEHLLTYFDYFFHSDDAYVWDSPLIESSVALEKTLSSLAEMPLLTSTVQEDMAISSSLAKGVVTLPANDAVNQSQKNKSSLPLGRSVSLRPGLSMSATRKKKTAPLPPGSSNTTPDILEMMIESDEKQDASSNVDASDSSIALRGNSRQLRPQPPPIPNINEELTLF